MLQTTVDSNAAGLSAQYNVSPSYQISGWGKSWYKHHMNSLIHTGIQRLSIYIELQQIQLMS